MTFNLKKLKEEERTKKTDANTSFYMESRRRGKILTSVISGIISVAEFSENKIVLITHGGRINISGTALTINIFEKQTVEITGKAESISFE